MKGKQFQMNRGAPSP